ncbi:hypothetical protein BGZ59_005346 [Podila verticillata]|nr:hypothetical protein BGZ59_005346 [Podila verticillata]
MVTCRYRIASLEPCHIREMLSAELTLYWHHRTTFLIKTTIPRSIIFQSSGILPQDHQIGATDTIHAIIMSDPQTSTGEIHTLILILTTPTTLYAQVWQERTGQQITGLTDTIMILDPTCDMIPNFGHGLGQTGIMVLTVDIASEVGTAPHPQNTGAVHLDIQVGYRGIHTHMAHLMIHRYRIALMLLIVGNNNYNFNYNNYNHNIKIITQLPMIPILHRVAVMKIWS